MVCVWSTLSTRVFLFIWEAMGSKDCKKICILLLYLTISATNSFTHCDARRSMHPFKGPTHPRNSLIKPTKKLKVTKHFNLASLILQKETMDESNSAPYVSSPFTLPPYDSLSPLPLPENAPPYCIYPPNTPQPASTIPTPTGYTPLLPPSPFYYLPPVLPVPGPPPSPTGQIPSPPEFTPLPYPPEIVPSPPTFVPNPPGFIPNPPIIIVPSPPETVPSPSIIIPSPPYYEPSPPGYFPSPPIFVPSPPTGVLPKPPTFLPPIVYPPPTVPPPPPRINPPSALWCVAKPSVPDPIIQEAMDYACASGADCDSIQPSGSCFEPNTLYAHASFAFNSYWQKTKVAGGTCSFGGTAMLVTVDPSYNGCHFLYAG